MLKVVKVRAKAKDSNHPSLSRTIVVSNNLMEMLAYLKTVTFLMKGPSRSRKSSQQRKLMVAKSKAASLPIFSDAVALRSLHQMCQLRV